MKRILVMVSAAWMAGPVAYAEGEATSAEAGDVDGNSAIVLVGDAAKGEKFFKKCAACHTVEPGKKKPGPHLQGILNRDAGGVEGFKYSKAMAESGLTWDVDTLRAFLMDPKGTVPKTKMSYRGVKKEVDLDNLIAYLAGL